MDLDAFIARCRQQGRDADSLARRLVVAPTDRVLNVHDYAWEAYEAFLRKFYGDEKPRIFAVSMNPGPFGAVQTGIPFCDRAMARRFLPDFERLVRGPPAWARADRSETSAAKLAAWATPLFGGMEGLYGRMILGMTVPLAILRGPSWTNVPLPALPKEGREEVYAFIRKHAAEEIRLCDPPGIFLLGDWAGKVWELVCAEDPDLGRLPSVAVPHPAAHISNETKFAAWTSGYRLLERRMNRIASGRPTGTARIRGS